MAVVAAFASLAAQAKSPEFYSGKFEQRPQRVIRTCCSFGSDMQLFAIPGIKLTDITSIEKIGPHKYLGDLNEENGIVYTRKGGFIDMGHLRDQADWTAYLYTQIKQNLPADSFSLDLGHEGGEKKVHLQVPPEMSDFNLIQLAGKIAYDLSVWHEIATWFGASTIPFVPERYSSFSVEDPFSNLLGVTIGMEALQSKLPYEEAVTFIISETLKNLGAVATETETYLAMEAVRNIWWTRDRKLPSGKVLLKRELQVYNCLQPWLVPGWDSPSETKKELHVPELTSDGQVLNNFYQLDFKLNYKFPFRKIFPERKDRSISQNDFEKLLAQIEIELNKKDRKLQ
jgi:hypothetical protein